MHFPPRPIGGRFVIEVEFPAGEQQRDESLQIPLHSPVEQDQLRLIRLQHGCDQ